MKIFCIFLFLALCSMKSHGNPVFIEVYRCDESIHFQCLLKDLLIEENAHFLPKSKNPNGITEVKLSSSTVSIFTSDICDAFPNLQVLRLDDVSLKKIEKGALDSCKKLTEIYLQNNLLTELDNELFSQNENLVKVVLNNNKLKSIPEKLFNGLSNLETIDLNANEISRLPSEIFDGLESMDTLKVSYNPLLSLEVEEFKQKMSNLENIGFYDLDLSCDRMKEVKEFCEVNSIGMDEERVFSDRVRSITVSNVFYKSLPSGYYNGQWYNSRDITSNCLSNEQHEREILLRETLPKMLGTENFENQELEMKQKFNELNSQYEKKIEEMRNKTVEIDSTYLKKIFEAQTFMLTLIMEVKENVEKIDARVQRLEGFDENL